MKFLLSLSFLLFAAASSINASSFFAEVPTPPPILDATGAPLQFGVPYYMLPAIWAWGGGVTLERATPSHPCPKLIHLTPEIDSGTPVVFSSPIPGVTGNITIGSDLIINFYNLTRPNEEYCGGSNSTTWVTTRTWDLAVGGEEISPVFMLTLGGVAHSYLLKPVGPFPKLRLVVGFGDSGNLVVKLQEPGINLSFVFREAKGTDKPVIIQMPRKMSV